jgi:hypothetical protein
VLLALFCKSHARYGTCAATYASALGPCHVPACTAANKSLSSVAAASYSALNACHAASAASNGPGPGPLESAAECTSGGKAAQIGMVIVGHHPDRPTVLDPFAMPCCIPPRRTVRGPRWRRRAIQPPKRSGLAPAFSWLHNCALRDGRRRRYRVVLASWQNVKTG